ncbi:MAG: transcription elongation factor GreAB [Oceanospirillaceae bacterium]|nr:transcription elongation factor GreAB [Oceanospirillaceae bacterium]MCP5349801.1 transcription elongation factor GreAB [Oceanospirillaceae bacterium]
MDKNALLATLLNTLQQELAETQLAAREAHEGAIHEQSKAETQYDTLGLEHAYLAEGQSRRISELQAEIVSLRNLPAASNDGQIRLNSLIRLEDEQDGSSLLLWLLPAGGAQHLPSPAGRIQVITPRSPIAGLLRGRSAGDSIRLANGREMFIATIE